MPILRRALASSAFAASAVTLGVSCAHAPETAAKPPTAQPQSTMTVISSPAPVPSSEHLLPTDARIAVSGRFATLSEGNGVLVGYPGVTFRVCVQGTQLTVRARSSNGKSRMLTRVDGVDQAETVLSATATDVTLWSSATSEAHCVEWVHLTETWIGSVTIEGFQVTGEAVQATPFPARRILLVGDSVTCGEGVKRTPDCAKTPSWWDPPQSYGALLGRLLGAESQLVCYGGRGLVRDWQGKSDTLTAPQYFELAVPDPELKPVWDPSRSVPDVVIVNLGTNDFTLGQPQFPDRKWFVSSYVTFVRRIREVYPNAPIFLTAGSMVNDQAEPKRPQKRTLNAYLKETQKRLMDPNVRLVELSHQPGDACDPHPLAEQHAVMADELAHAIAPVLGWQL